MGKLLEIVTPLHTSTTRDYPGRMMDSKIECMEIAKCYAVDYWDGDRRYGYGGYKYIPNWWSGVAKKLVENYNLTNDSKVLDVGCGKAFLLWELRSLLPGLEIAGFDVSEHGLDCACQEIRHCLHIGRAQEKYRYPDDYFDLVISINCLHNLNLLELSVALTELERVGEAGYIVVESYRSNVELFNLQCWALTADSFLQPSEWEWLFEKTGYTGDFEFIFFS
jgi:SAM-dependent methyltransferase